MDLPLSFKSDSFIAESAQTADILAGFGAAGNRHGESRERAEQM
jgi:hypothetical protein